MGTTLYTHILYYILYSDCGGPAIVFHRTMSIMTQFPSYHVTGTYNNNYSPVIVIGRSFYSYLFIIYIHTNKRREHPTQQFHRPRFTRRLPLTRIRTHKYFKDFLPNRPQRFWTDNKGDDHCTPFSLAHTHTPYVFRFLAIDHYSHVESSHLTTAIYII